MFDHLRHFTFVSYVCSTSFRVIAAMILESESLGLKLHHDNTSVQFIPPRTPFLYSKTPVNRGGHFFLIFALKHRLWVLIRTALRRFTKNLCLEQKLEKISHFLLRAENCNFKNIKIHSILHRSIN